jgi:hypothetical protein
MVGVYSKDALFQLITDWVWCRDPGFVDIQWGRFELSTNVLPEHTCVCITDAKDIDRLSPSTLRYVLQRCCRFHRSQRLSRLAYYPGLLESLFCTSVRQVATVVNMQANYKNPSWTVRNNLREGGEKR